MKRNTQKLYESIMKVVDKSVRNALNESTDEYYVWYNNHEDGETHDMSYNEIRAYQIGWQIAGPFSNINDAIKSMKQDVKKTLLELWFVFEDDWIYEHEDEDDPTDEQKFKYIRKNCDEFFVSKNKQQILFREHDESNTYEWNILTAEEVKRREEQFNNDNNDEDYDDF